MSTQESLPVQAPEEKCDAEFTDFFKEHAPSLNGYFRKNCDDHGLCEDAFQETMLIIRAKWTRVREMENPRAYLFTVGVRKLRKMMKQKTERDRRVDGLRDATSPRSVAKDVTNHEWVKSIVEKLPRRQREVTVLHYMYAFSVRETADILGISEGTVKGYLHQARNSLSDIVKAD